MIRLGSLWAMLAAVWAFVLLGGAPLPARADLCGAGPGPVHHHDAGCVLCCPCTVNGAMEAVPVQAAALPTPRGRALAGSPAMTPPGDARPRTVPVRARGPPHVA